MTDTELKEICRQYMEGLTTSVELLLRVQVSPEVQERLEIASKLPYKAAAKICIEDLLSDDPRDEPFQIQPHPRMPEENELSLKATHLLSCVNTMGEDRWEARAVTGHATCTKVTFRTVQDARDFSVWYSEQCTLLGYAHKKSKLINNNYVTTTEAKLARVVDLIKRAEYWKELLNTYGYSFETEFDGLLSIFGGSSRGKINQLNTDLNRHAIEFTRTFNRIRIVETDLRKFIAKLADDVEMFEED